MTKVYNISFLILAFCSLSVFAQRTYETNSDRKRAFNWMFGDSIWLDFKTNPPTQNNGSQLKALESAATISDTAGNLLFYTDGITVWNANHKIIQNGTNLGGNHSSSQGCIFIKHPSNDSIVYLFTTDAQGGNKGFQVNTIYISANIDSSIIIVKNKVLLNESCESIAATQHQNGIYTWVTVHSKFGNTFYAYLINENGLVECPITSNEGYDYDGHIFNCQTTSNFSDNGTYFALNMLNDFKAQLLHFDNNNGVFKLINQFTSLNVPTGISFSNDNKYLYIVERGKQINQINITNWQNNIVKNIDNKFMIIQIEKTPYKEIYVNVIDSFYLSSIKSPDLLGSNANFVLRDIYLNGKIGKNGLCNFNNSFNFLPSIDYTYQLDCINNTIQFQGKDTFYANIYSWQYRKKYSVNDYTLFGNTKNINLAFIDTGIYEVRYIAENDIRKDTIIKTIKIHPKIKKNFLGNDTAFAFASPVSKLLKTPKSAYCYYWQDSSRQSSFLADTAGVYYCKIITETFCELTDTIRISYCKDSLIMPLINRVNDSLLITNITHGDSFIWYRNNQVYTVNKIPAIKLVDTGTFRVDVVKKGYCNKSSYSVNVNKLGIYKLSLRTAGINIFPNPVSNNLNIYFVQNGDYHITIFNSLGQKVHEQQTTTNISIPLNGLSAGVYSVQINNKTQQFNTIILKE